MGNRMVQAVRKEKGDAVLTQTNRYNGSGQHIQKTEDGKTTNYYYQGTAVRATTDAEGNKSSFNLYGLEGNVIASGRYTGSCAGEYLTSGKDLKGSITSLIKPDGSCAAVYRYTDFGETVMYAAEDVENEICYTGGIYDESTGLYYLNARYYDPQDGRFTSQDTYRGKDEEYKTWNLYTYCANNPVGYIDPSGHSAIALFTAAARAYEAGKALLGAIALLVTTYYTGRVVRNAPIVTRVPVYRPIPKPPVIRKPRVQPVPKAPAVPNTRVLPTPKAPAVPRTKVTPGTKSKKRIKYVKRKLKNNFVRVSDQYLKKQGIDAHELKRDVMGDKNMSKAEIYYDKVTKLLYVFRKGASCIIQV